MKTQRAKRSADELLQELAILMHDKKYDSVSDLLETFPELINNLTPRCEVPLVMAIKCWDPKLVGICMKHGANPTEKHHCSKDKKDKIPILITFEQFCKRIHKLKTRQAWDRHFRIYSQMILEMTEVAPFSKG